VQCTCAITLRELDLGLLLVERRDPAQAARLRTWMAGHVLPELSDRTLPVDKPVARRSARLHVPEPRPERDAFIAACALTHGMTMVTRNVADFSPMASASSIHGLPCPDPTPAPLKAGARVITKMNQ
jgi:predicted nucleic acid-binding protein